MLIVQVCDFGSDGDARYRLHDPSRYLGRIPGVTTVDCHFFSRFLPELSELADVLVLQFVKDWSLVELVERRRLAGKPTVFEANDYFFDLQSWNPIVGHWQDRTVQELYLQLLRLCDGVQTSTAELGRRWKQRGAREVAVFPNYLTEVPPLPPTPARPLTIGWAGSPGHLADWYDIAPVLQKWLDAHPHVHLAVMTNELGKDFFRLSADRYRFAPFASLEAYLQFLAGIDIGIAPLLPTGYNRCRSDVKFLEYASQGVAGIYQDLEPYRQSVTPGERGLLYRSHEELIQCLDRLSSDDELRNHIRSEGYQYVIGHRMIPDNILERLKWYKSLAKDSKTVPLPAEIASQALADQNYLQLPVREPERTLRDSLLATAPAQASSMLAPLLEKFPKYLAAIQHQGRLLNDQRQHRAALEILERARLLHPQSARTISEIGRAWYRLNQDDKARASMEEAVRANPHYLPAWQYLLRLLAFAKASDGPMFARRAEELFPDCYPISLLAVATYPPAEAPGMLLAALKRYSGRILDIERTTALSALRQAILDVLKTAPPEVDLVPLLARACEIFPESARLASEYAAALSRAGQHEESHAQYARASELRKAAAIEREEFPRDNTPPLLWQFAEHIRNYRVGRALPAD